MRGQRADWRPPIDRTGASRVSEKGAATRAHPARRSGSGRASPSREGPSNSIFKEFQQLGRQRAVLGLDNLSGKDRPSFQGLDPDIPEALSEPLGAVGPVSSGRGHIEGANPVVKA